MRVFVAGATGAIGRPLVTRLLAEGHTVTAMTRSPERADALRAQGAQTVVADAFDAEAVHAAVVAARPEVVVHQLTALPQHIDVRRYAEAVAPTNRLREEATPHLVAAAAAAGARRVVAQSISFVTTPDGPSVKDEDSPLWLDAPGGLGGAVRAVQALERTVLGAGSPEGVVLRYGYFYGAGTAFGCDGASTRDVRRRRFPVVGPGTGVFSFVHVDDAVEATVLALDHGAPGVYNVTDDDPAQASDWLPEMARILGARPPRRVPAWLARRLVDPGIARMAVDMRGASNARAKAQLGWAPRHSSWRQGFRATLAEA